MFHRKMCNMWVVLLSSRQPARFLLFRTIHSTRVNHHVFPRCPASMPIPPFPLFPPPISPPFFPGNGEWAVGRRAGLMTSNNNNDRFPSSPFLSLAVCCGGRGRRRTTKFTLSLRFQNDAAHWRSRLVPPSTHTHSLSPPPPPPLAESSWGGRRGRRQPWGKRARKPTTLSEPPPNPKTQRTRSSSSSSSSSPLFPSPRKVRPRLFPAQGEDGAGNSTITCKTHMCPQGLFSHIGQLESGDCEQCCARCWSNPSPPLPARPDAGEEEAEADALVCA